MDEGTAIEPEEAPTRVRVVLILRTGRTIVAGPTSPSVADLVLPSHELCAGQSIAAAANAISAELLDRGLGAGALRGLCLVPAEAEHSDVVELCVEATIDHGSPAAALAVKAPWAFHPEAGSSWSATAARTLALRPGVFTAIDLDGSVLPLGGVAPAPGSPADDPALLLRSPPPREPVVLGLAITGGVACVSGTIWALALVNVFEAQLALGLWVLALVGVFAAAAHGRPRRLVIIASVLVLPMGFAFLLLSMMFGGGDAPHFAFFLWAFGAASLAVALFRLGRNTQLGEQQRMRRRIAWAAAALVSLITVFPPLRDAIFKRGETSELDERAPTPRAPDDD
jgi:hypothetical protein